MTKTRTLYQVRNHTAGNSGKQVGFKGRLLPRTAATRVARRLRRSGLDITISAMTVNVTPSQAIALIGRYA